jgi:Tfp pilus assembly protein FimT
MAAQFRASGHHRVVASRHNGFTLVELLVVSCSDLLAGLLL